MQISEILNPESIIIDLPAPSKVRLIQTLSEKVAKAIGASESKVFAALNNREKLGSTGIGEGVAIPHAAVLGVDAPFGLLIRLAKPIAFEAIDDIPVDIVCLLLMPAEKTSSHLNALACIARALQSRDTLEIIRNSTRRDEIYDHLLE